MRSKVPYVYIVDDNTISLKILQKKIRRTIGCNVRIFTTAEECIRTIELRMPKLVLADYYLDSDYKKRMNGDDLLQKIRLKYPQLPVIMYSSTDSVKLVVQLIKSGAQDFIPRNTNFIPEITRATACYVNRKTFNRKLKKALIRYSGFILGFAALYTVTYYYKPEWLIYLGLFSVFILTAVVFPMLLSKSNKHS